MGGTKWGDLWVSGFPKRLPQFTGSSLLSHRDIHKSFVLLFFLASCVLSSIQQDLGQVGCVNIGRQRLKWPMETFFLCTLTINHLQVGRLESQP